jgi:hypothetical protein
VSVDGGAQVRWNSNGKELFYLATDNRLMAVPIRFLPDGFTPNPGRHCRCSRRLLGIRAAL